MTKPATKRAKRKPDDLRKRVNRAIEKLVAEDFAGALADLEPLVGESTGDKYLASVVLHHRGRAKAELGDEKGALRDYDRAIALAPAAAPRRICASPSRMTTSVPRTPSTTRCCAAPSPRCARRRAIPTVHSRRSSAPCTSIRRGAPRRRSSPR